MRLSNSDICQLGHLGYSGLRVPEIASAVGARLCPWPFVEDIDCLIKLALHRHTLTLTRTVIYDPGKRGI